MVHTKELAPVLKPVTSEKGLFTDVKFPVPLSTDHVPVPVAFNVADDAHTV